MNRTLRMWMIWVMAAAAPFFIFPSEAAVWDGPPVSSCRSKGGGCLCIYKICGYSRTRYLCDTDNQGRIR